MITVSAYNGGGYRSGAVPGTAAFNEPLSGGCWPPSPAPGTLAGVAVGGVRHRRPAARAVLSAAIRGLERFRRQALIEYCAGVADCRSNLLLRGTRSLEVILGAQCVVYLASMLVRAVALRRLLPDGRLFALSGGAEAGTLFRYGGWMWLAALAGVAYTSVDRIIVGRNLARLPPANTIFMSRSLAHPLHPQQRLRFSFPTFSRLAAQGNSRSEIAQAHTGPICLPSAWRLLQSPWQ